MAADGPVRLTDDELRQIFLAPMMVSTETSEAIQLRFEVTRARKEEERLRRELSAVRRRRRGAAEKLIKILWLYPNYRVDSRCPMGLLVDAIDALAPDLAERLRAGEDPSDLIDFGEVAH